MPKYSKPFNVVCPRCDGTIECEIVHFEPGRPAQVSGPSDSWAPAEGPEIEWMFLDQCPSCGIKEDDLTNQEIDEITTVAFEQYADYDPREDY